MTKKELDMFKLEYAVANIQYKDCKEVRDRCLGSFDAGDMQLLSTLSMSVHNAELKLRECRLKFLIAEAEYTRSVEPNNQALIDCKAEYEEYSKHMDVFKTVGYEMVEAWNKYENSKDGSAKQIASAKHEYQQIEIAYITAERLYFKARCNYAEAWEKATK